MLATEWYHYIFYVIGGITLLGGIIAVLAMLGQAGMLLGLLAFSPFWLYRKIRGWRRIAAYYGDRFDKDGIRYYWMDVDGMEWARLGFYKDHMGVPIFPTEFRSLHGPVCVKYHRDRWWWCDRFGEPVRRPRKAKKPGDPRLAGPGPDAEIVMKRLARKNSLVSVPGRPDPFERVPA